ncbi:NAD binding Rossmann fold oxidoreductase [Apiospora aurea]|uniref:NAD binding Rossmann fold oxidoreductase n=1 Tax=Apiospora aurea TaxID=335848 RepID=A0ABR1Q2G2_9PEZI
MRFTSTLLRFAAAALGASTTAAAKSKAAKRVAIAGLVHGHVTGMLPGLLKRTDVRLVAIAEPDKALSQEYASSYNLSSDLFHTDLDGMLQDQHPDAVLVYTTILDHRHVIGAAAEYGISSMVEKPLSTTMEDALAIREMARKRNVHVLVNYETTWYASNAAALAAARNGSLGPIRKVVVHDGHQGPAEIGVGPEWLPWLTDPAQNGAGALFDFGCYGADLVTVLHGGSRRRASWRWRRRTSRTSGADAVVGLGVPAQGYGGVRDECERDDGGGRQRGEEGGCEPGGGRGGARAAGGARRSFDLFDRGAGREGPGRGGLTSLDTNMVAMQILDAARTSAKTGKAVQIQPLPS